MYNQEACVASRFQFVEGELDDIDRYCAALAGQLGKDRRTATASGTPVPADVRDECAEHVPQLNAAIPSVVFVAQDAAGNDISAVKVTMDGIAQRFPEGLTYAIPSDTTRFQENFTKILHQLTRTHGFAVDAADSTSLDYVYRAKASGVTIVIVEQYVERAMDVATKVCVMTKGQIAFSGHPSDVSASELAQLYLN